MHFLFHIKKTQTAQLHHDKLKNKNICAYPADNVQFFEGGSWELFAYSYNFEIVEEISEAVEQCGDKLNVKLGVFSDNDEHASMGHYFGDYWDNCGNNFRILWWVDRQYSSKDHRDH